MTGDKQHGEQTGHLDPVTEGVEVVGKAPVANPSGAGLQGRIADVSAYGDHAFLNAFRGPDCQMTGSHVMDISDPQNPVEIPEAFMETSPGNYAGEGSQALRVENEHFDGVIYVFQNETCPGADPIAPGERGGIHIWDITDPREPELLGAHVGDYTLNGVERDQANTVHSVHVWNNDFDGRTYAVLVDNEEATDVDIMDITNPREPVMVNDTLDLTEAPFNAGQHDPPNLTDVFLHDMWVKRIGARYVMVASYWDGGYLLLDVTDPTPGNVSLIAQTEFAELDEERLKRGHEIAPEGNAHYAELSPDNRFMIAADEDFNPYRIVSTIDSGPYAGTEYMAVQASGTPAIDTETTVSGTPTYVGLACDELPAGTGIALVERGACPFQDKLDNITAAGYEAGIVFNIEGAGCEGRVNMLAEGSIPFVFVDRMSGLHLLQVPGVDPHSACATATPETGSEASATTIASVFSGWGYIRLFRTQIPGGVDRPGHIRQIDTFAVAEAQDEAYATGYGDLSVHKATFDPNPGTRLVYAAYYAAGFRVLEYGPGGLKEVGAFIDEGGSNFWGMFVHEVDGEQYVLVSDRDYGLYILRPDL